MSREEKIEGYLRQIRIKARQYAEAKGELVRLQEYKRVIRARLMHQALEEGHKTIAAQERESDRDPQYQDYLLALSAATENETRLHWELKTAEWEVELYRTQEASRRAEIRGYAA